VVMVGVWSLIDNAGASPVLAHAGLHNFDVWSSGEQEAEQACDVRLRLECDHAASERGHGSGSIPDMGAQIERQIAPCDEPGVEARRRSTWCSTGFKS